MNRAIERWVQQIPENVVREAESGFADKFVKLTETARCGDGFGNSKNEDVRKLLRREIERGLKLSTKKFDWLKANNVGFAQNAELEKHFSHSSTILMKRFKRRQSFDAPPPIFPTKEACHRHDCRRMKCQPLVKVIGRA